MKEGESVFEGRAPFQVKMQEIYEGLGVPYSKIKKKGESRVQCSEKLGAQLDGARGTLGASRKRCLELVSLGSEFLQQLDRVPTKWIQIFLGKFVHIMSVPEAVVLHGRTPLEAGGSFFRRTTNSQGGNRDRCFTNACCPSATAISVQGSQGRLQLQMPQSPEEDLLEVWAWQDPG